MAPIFPYRCDVCCLSMNSHEQLTQHFSGSRHKRNEARKASGGSTNPALINPSDYFVSSGFIGGPGQADNSQSIAQGQSSKTEAVTNVNCPSYCATCRVQLTSSSQAEMHYKGGKHRQKLKLLEENAVREDDNVAAKKPRFEFCEVCNVKLLSPAVAEPHYTGDKHKKKIRLLQSRGFNTNDSHGPVQQGPAPAAIVSNVTANPGNGQAKQQPFFCSFCGVSVNSQSQMDAHRTGNKHKVNVQKCMNPQTTATLPSPITYPQPVQDQSTYQYQSIKQDVEDQTFFTQY